VVDDERTAIVLAQQLGPARRALLRAAEAAGGLPALPEAQIEVLRLLVASGPLSSAAIAARLRLARSTVSNLVKPMSAEGLIEREIAEGDLRVALLAASERARELLRRYDEASATVVRAALASLEPVDRAALAAAARAIGALATALSGGLPAPTEPAASSRG